MSAEPTAAQREQLARAVLLLENPSFAARLAERAGQPVNQVMKLLPRLAQDSLQGVVNVAVGQCLKLAIGSLALPVGLRRPRPASTWLAKLLTGVTGGVGGLFGLAALPVELPLTTTLMFRSIAQIARSEGEDLSRIQGRLACLEVFALGDRRSSGSSAVGYYAARTTVTQLTSDAAAYLAVDRGAVEVSTPVLTRLLGEIASRFGFVVTERMAAGAVPVIAAVGSASVNMIFMEHFQRIARGHFMVRRLERECGAETIRRLYGELAGSS